jgi:hypothetical protein
MYRGEPATRTIFYTLETLEVAGEETLGTSKPSDAITPIFGGDVPSRPEEGLYV